MFEATQRSGDLNARVGNFMDEHVYPNEARDLAEAEQLGPGRIHHCMRLIGVAERSLEKMCRRAHTRVAFGKAVSEQTVNQERSGESCIMIEQGRRLPLKAAYMMDTVGNKAVRAEIAMIKVAVPNMACQVVDRVIQVHGGGTGNDFGLAMAYATARLPRLADGPDEVYRNQIAHLELRKHVPGNGHV